MRFGNRLNFESPEQWRDKNVQYHATLRKLGFSNADPLFCYFAWEVFHDGEIAVERIDLMAREVTLKLRNVFAVNKVSAYLIRKGRPLTEINRRDFVTRITLSGVAQFSISSKGSAAALWYQCAELAKVGRRNRLEIRFDGGGGPSGLLTVLFEAAHIGDITARLRRYVPRGDLRRFLYPTTDSALSKFH